MKSVCSIEKTQPEAENNLPGAQEATPPYNGVTYLPNAIDYVQVLRITSTTMPRYGGDGLVTKCPVVKLKLILALTLKDQIPMGLTSKRMSDFLRHIPGARAVTSRRYIFVVGLSAALTCSAQTKTPVRGGMNAELTVLSLEPSIAFYQNVLGLEAPIARFSPALPGVGQLTGTITGGIRLARMPVPGAPWTVELVETTGVDRKPLNARRQDIGASGTDVVHCVDPGSRKAGARVHAAAVHSEVKPAWSDTQPGTVEAEVDVNAGSDVKGTAKAQGHWIYLPLFRGPMI